MKLLLAKEEKIEKLTKCAEEKESRADEQKRILEEKEKQVSQLTASIQRLKDSMNHTLKEQLMTFKGNICISEAPFVRFLRYITHIQSSQKK